MKIRSSIMKILRNNLWFIIFAAIVAATVFVMPASASITDGTIDSTDKYAWGENIGWINFGTSEGNVHITDSALTGYAWGENIGWISLNCSNGDSCSVVDYKVANDGAGNLSGYAWSENAGWINFSPTYGGVTINSSGEFLGYAWGENVGWIVFNCATTSSCSTVDYKVKTDWRPQNARPACDNSLDDDGDGKIDYPNDPGCDSLTDDNETDPAGGGLPPEAYNPPIPPSSAPENPEGKFSILINNGDEYTTSETVNLKFYVGSNTEKMAISNTADFVGASQILYQEEIEWKLLPIFNDEFLISNQTLNPNSQITNYKLRTVYAKFYTQYGIASEVVSDNINLISEKLEPAVSPESKPTSNPVLPEIPTPSPTSPAPAVPPVSSAEIPSALPTPSVQLPEQPLIPPSSEPNIKEPETPPPFSQPLGPPEPEETIQPKPAEIITSEFSKQPSFVGGFWQSAKIAFKNIFGAIVAGFNNAGKKIADTFNQSQNSFAVFIKDIKILGREIKIAVFESSNPLQISDVRVISISSTSVEVVWQTNHKATSKVNYGLSRIYDREKQDSKKVKSHSVILTNLNSGTTYHYEVISQNGSYAYDADRIFVTAGE